MDDGDDSTTAPRQERRRAIWNQWSNCPVVVEVVVHGVVVVVVVEVFVLVVASCLHMAAVRRRRSITD